MLKWFNSCRFIITPEHTYEFFAYKCVLFLDSILIFLWTSFLSYCQFTISKHFLLFDLFYFIFQIVFKLFSNSSLYVEINIQGVYVLFTLICCYFLLNIHHLFHLSDFSPWAIIIYMRLWRSWMFISHYHRLHVSSLCSGI